MARRDYLSSAAVACLFVAGGAHAQTQTQTQTPTAPPTADAQVDEVSQTGVGEIVVTAQRVSSSAQKTPVALEVYDGSKLARSGIGSIQDLTRIAPNLGFTNVQGESHLTLRGITSSDVTESGDPAVVIAFDGFYLARPYTMSQGIYDIDRVEILKGPQGTLFGRNAVGGVVSVVSHAPTREFEGRVGLEFGNYGAINTEGMLNIPLNEKVQMRAAFQTRRHSGYRRSTLIGSVPGISKRQDDEDMQSGRVTLAFQPTDGLDGQISVQYTRQGGNGDGPLYVPWAYGANGLLIHTVPPIPSSKNYAVAAFGGLDAESRRVFGRLSYDQLPGGITLTYIGGYDDTEWHHLINNTPPGSIGTNFRQNEFPKTLNQELRLTSAQDGPFTWQAGVFYFRERSGLFSQAVTIDGRTEIIHFDYPKVVAASKAAYGQANYAINDLIKVSGGLRYTKDTRSRRGDFVITVANPANPPVINQDGKGGSSKLTYHAGIDITPTPRNLIYLKTDSGYKAAGFNSGVAGLTKLSPETITAYEVGSKNRFWNNKLQINADGFYYKYTNLLSLSFPAGGQTSTGAIVTNAKGATVYGADLEVVLAPTSDDRISAQASWLHARYTDYSLPPTQPLDPAIYQSCVGPLGGQICQLKGYTLPEAPNATFTIDAQHTFREVAGGDLTVQADVAYKSRIWFDSFNYGDTRQGAYALFNASVSYYNQENDITATAFIYNIGDKRYFTNAQEFGAGGTNSYLYAFGTPRIFGARLTKGF